MLCTILNQVHSQQKQLKIIWKEKQKGFIHYELSQRNTIVLETVFTWLLAMVKQLGILTYFLTLSCADLRWEELPFIIKLNNLGFNEEELKILNYRECYNLLNNNPILVARHFHYQCYIQMFFGHTVFLKLRIG